MFCGILGWGTEFVTDTNRSWGNCVRGKATALFTQRRVIASAGDQGKAFTVGLLIIYCVFGVLAGIVGGLLGLGGGFVMGPLFLELGVPSQSSESFKLQYINRHSLILIIKQLVPSATTTFAMTFSSSMSVVEYYLLKRFPIPYGLCRDSF
ncbi:hypothetical protein MtrunA17_Chr3g0139621 [Medicago truncatula]|uniref:Transmembrane protein, putative n=1 Tax=Medicago truncatula TaxID=3880 RepID=G7ZWN8_MEDTR|nr:transmembrane protein, putative [Medicago truncatula]KEH36001.1 transmembrane protein, putative [Medicago truncatula]RHN70818.1 hypothetical protein MtrunA17_Chr3g0139621 [Medicago truncatula]